MGTGSHNYLVKHIVISTSSSTSPTAHIFSSKYPSPQLPSCTRSPSCTHHCLLLIEFILGDPILHQIQGRITRITPHWTHQYFAIHHTKRALTPNTSNSYSTGILRFMEFCDKYNIPKNSHMPASNILLAAFISEYSGTCIPASLTGCQD